MTTRACGLGLVLGVLLPACSDSDGPATAEGPVDASPMRVCPSCIAGSEIAGNETSDFSGSEPACTGDLAPAPDDVAWSSRIEEVREVYAGAFEASLRWTYASLDEPDAAGAFWEERPSGYQPSTSVSGNVVLEPTQFIKGRPMSPMSDLECPDWYRVPVTVELAAEDGSLAGTARGFFYVGLGPARLWASVDLADAVGTLDLHLDPTLEYRGSADLTFNFHPEGKRGSITVEVSPMGPGADPGAGYWPLTSAFPDDGCDRGFPSTADVPLPWVGGQTAAQVLQSWNTALDGFPIPALRQDCAPGSMAETPVELSFDIGAPDANLCELPAWPAGGVDGGFTFNSAIRLRTADGRIDLPLVSGSVGPTELTLFSDPTLYPSRDLSLLIPPDQFAAESGILGVHPGNSAALGYYATASFSRSGGTIVPGGVLSVMGLECTGESCSVPVHSAVLWPIDESAHIPHCRL